MMRDFIKLIIGVVGIFLLVFWAAAQLDHLGCYQSWKDSGLPYKWSVLGGCKVSTDHGKTYIPDETYRQVE